MMFYLNSREQWSAENVERLAEEVICGLVNTECECMKKFRSCGSIFTFHQYGPRLMPARCHTWFQFIVDPPTPPPPKKNPLTRSRIHKNHADKAYVTSSVYANVIYLFYPTKQT